jgi:hypothetical protein
MMETPEAQAWYIRDALARLVANARYSLIEISRRTDTAYRSVQRYLTVNGADKDLPPLPFVINLLALMSGDDSVPQVDSPGQWIDDTLREFRG